MFQSNCNHLIDMLTKFCQNHISLPLLSYATVPLKQLYLIHTVVQCIPQVFGVTLKNSLKGIIVAYNNSFRILHNLSPRCSASHMFATNYVKSFNERIRS